MLHPPPGKVKERMAEKRSGRRELSQTAVPARGLGIKHYRAGYPAAGPRSVCGPRGNQHPLWRCLASFEAFQATLRNGVAGYTIVRFMHQGERTYLIVIQPGERGDPIVPHSVDCDGYLIVEEHGKMADLKCNSCGAVVDTVPLEARRPKTNATRVSGDLQRAVSVLRSNQRACWL